MKTDFWVVCHPLVLVWVVLRFTIIYAFRLNLFKVRQLWGMGKVGQQMSYLSEDHYLSCLIASRIRSSGK